MHEVFCGVMTNPSFISEQGGCWDMLLLVLKCNQVIDGKGNTGTLKHQELQAGLEKSWKVCDALKTWRNAALTSTPGGQRKACTPVANEAVTSLFEYSGPLHPDEGTGWYARVYFYAFSNLRKKKPFITFQNVARGPELFSTFLLNWAVSSC